MKLIDSVNPWGALRRARAETRYYAASVAILRGIKERDVDARKAEKKAHELKVNKLEGEIKRLEKIIAEGHYRNPKTGRLGRKGEVFTK
jgi:hypothetical protein